MSKATYPLKLPLSIKKGCPAPGQRRRSVFKLSWRTREIAEMNTEVGLLTPHKPIGKSYKLKHEQPEQK